MKLLSFHDYTFGPDSVNEGKTNWTRASLGRALLGLNEAQKDCVKLGKAQEAKDLNRIILNVHDIINALRASDEKVSEAIVSEGGHSIADIIDEVYAKVKDADGWEAKAEKIFRDEWKMNKDQVRDAMNKLRGEDYFDTGDVVMESATVELDGYISSRNINRKLYGRLVDGIKKAVDDIKKENVRGNDIGLAHNAKIEIGMSAKYPNYAYVTWKWVGGEDPEEAEYENADTVLMTTIEEVIDEVGFSHKDTYTKNGKAYVTFSD